MLDSASIVVSTCIIITPSIFQQILYTSVGRVQKKQDDLAKLEPDIIVIIITLTI